MRLGFAGSDSGGFARAACLSLAHKKTAKPESGGGFF